MTQLKAQSPLGVSQAHDSAELHVAGTATYTDDVREPAGCLQAYVLQSPHAHAKILKIDTSACWIAGVHGVVTAKDIPGVNDVSPAIPGDPLFADGVVMFAGQSVLAVAADTIEIARKAAKLAVVDYEALPAILDVKAAMAAKSYVGDPYTMKIGDSTAGIKGAAHKLSGTLDVGGQDHFYLEGQISMATPLENGEMHCWCSTQHPSEVQHLIAKVLGVSDHLVTVDVRRMGGGFGGKESQASLFACAAALLARKTNRPVKLRVDRDDDMIMTGKRHDFEASYTVGFDDAGRIQGIEINYAFNCGYSPDLSNAIADRAMFHSDNAYFLGNATVTTYRCKTNKVSNTAFRGFGGPQGVLMIEYIIDEIARKLGKEPQDVRKVNLYDPKGKLDKRCTTHYYMTVEDSITHEIFAQLEKSGDYANRVKEVKEFNKNNKILKKGIALTPVKFGISFTLTMLNQAGALVHVYKDGSVQVNHGGTEMGQGLHTKICQVVADEFGIALDKVRITATSTGKVPNTSATAASSGADMNGKAAQAAARTIKERLLAFDAGRNLPWKELVMQAYMARISLSSTGFYATPKINWDRPAARGRPFYYFAYGAALAEVIVDTLTGEHKILRADILHDVGRSMNPAIDIGQIEGGFIQGAGWLTSEELWWNDKGVLKTHAPSTYKVPTGRDAPKVFNVALYDGANQEDTIYNSKAVGEPPLMLGTAVFLAIKDAIASVNPKVKLNAPATPERVLKAVLNVA